MTEGTGIDQTLQKGILLELLRHIGNTGMFDIEGHKPVAELREERETFHLRETTEIDIRTLFLHLLHPLELLFHLLHPPFFFIGMEDIIQRMVLHFLNTVPRHPETVVLQQVGHNLSLDGLVVFLGIDTQNDLMLQLHQLLTDGRIFQHLIQHLLLITIEINEDIILQSQGPTDQGSLTDSGISGMTIYGQQHLELRQIEMI